MLLYRIYTYGSYRDRSVVTRSSYISFSEDRIYVLAMNNSDRTTHVLRDLQKISVKAGTTSLAANFKILAVNLSGSEALCLSRSML